MKELPYFLKSASNSYLWKLIIFLESLFIYFDTSLLYHFSFFSSTHLRATWFKFPPRSFSLKFPNSSTYGNTLVYFCRCIWFPSEIAFPLNGTFLAQMPPFSIQIPHRRNRLIMCSFHTETSALGSFLTEQTATTSQVKQT